MSAQSRARIESVSRSRRGRLIASGALVVAMAATGFIASPAVGDQNDIDRVAAQVTELENRAAAAGERANGARIAVAKAQRQLAVMEGRLKVAKDELTAQRENLTKLVRQLYVNGGLDGALLSFTLDDPSDLLTQLDQLSVVSTSQTGVVEAARTAAVELQRSEEAVRVESERLDAAAADLSAQEDAAHTRLAEAENLLASLKEEERRRLAAIEEAKRQAAIAAARKAAAELAAQQAEQARAAQAEAARQAAAAAEQQAAAAAAADPEPADPEPAATDGSADAGDSNGPSEDSGAEAPAPNPGGYGSGSVSEVISYALAQVGKSYVWGAEGPDSFDCSGLTMMAWRQAGVSLTHYSGSQYDETQQVSTDSLQPGDLLYFYAISEHVGLYIGNGEFVHASNPRVGVVHATLDDYWRSNLVAASRPG